MSTPDIDDCYRYEGADGPEDGLVTPTLRFAFYIQPEQSNGFETFPAEVVPYVSESGRYVEFESHSAAVAALKARVDELLAGDHATLEEMNATKTALAAANARIAELEQELENTHAELYEATNGD